MRTPGNLRGIFIQKSLVFTFLTALLATAASAQQSVSIGDTQTKSGAVLYLKSANSNQGLIIPLVNSRNSISGSGAEAGMVVFDKSDNKIYYYNGTAWVEAGGSTGGTPVTLTAGQNVTITGTFPNFTISAPAVDAIVGNEVTQVNTARGGLELSGSGTAASPLSVGLIQGTVDGQVLRWDNTNKRWALATVSGGGGSGTVTNVATGTGLTGGPITTTGTISLSTTGVAANTYGSATSAAQVTVDAQGRITAAQSNTFPDASATNEIQNLTFGGTGSATTGENFPLNISSGTGVTIKEGTNVSITQAANVLTINSSGGAGGVTSVDTGTGLTGGPITSTGTISLSTTGVAANTYGSTTTMSQVTVDAQGRITAAQSNALPDASATNEIQNLTFTGTGSATPGETFPLNISSGTGVSIQEGSNVTITHAANVLTINASGGGGSALTTQFAVPRGDGTNQIASQLYDNGTNVGLGTTTPVKKFDVNGDINISTGSSLFVNNVRVFNTTGNSNTFLGTRAGLVQTGNHNTFLGFETGTATTSGTYNLFAGRGAGSANTTGSYNLYVGADAGFNMVSGSLNTFLGFNAGKAATAMTSGTILGNKAGEETTGDFNTFVGERAGQKTVGGEENTMVGRISGATNVTGSRNTLIGHNANVSGDGLSNATAIGHNAIVGASNTVVLGSGADVGIGTSDPGVEAGAARYLTVAAGLAPNSGIGAIEIQGGQGSVGNPIGRIDFISNSSPGDVSIARIEARSAGGAQFKGDLVFYTRTGTPFASSALDEKMRITEDGMIGMGRTPTANALEVNGNASKTTASSWAANSDRRIKTDIQDVTDGIATIKRLHPVKFKYTPYWMAKNPSIKNQYYYNYIAQEYQEVFPNAVKGSGEFIEGDSKEVLQVDTYDTQIVMVKAMQELIDKVERLEKENQKLRDEKTNAVNELRAEIEQIKKILMVEAKAEQKK